MFDNWIHEPAYLSGMIAGKLTKSNTVGAVAAMAIPEVNRLANAFCAGAKEVNPEVKCKFTFIGSFFDPPKAKEAAHRADRGRGRRDLCRALRRHRGGAGKGSLAFSNMSDQSSLAPDTVITGPVWDMWPTVKQAVKLVQAGVFTAQDYGDFSSMGKGGAYLAPYQTGREAARRGQGRGGQRSRRSWTATSASTSTKRSRCPTEPIPRRGNARRPVPARTR